MPNQPSAGAMRAAIRTRIILLEMQGNFSAEDVLNTENFPHLGIAEAINRETGAAELLTLLKNCLGSLEACELILRPKTERARLSSDIRDARAAIAKYEGKV